LFAKLLGRKQSDKDIYDRLNLEEQDMIRGIIKLSETTVKEIMVPRIDVKFIGLHMSPKEVADKVSENGHSRFPVYKDSSDNVVGVLYVKDMLRFMFTDQDFDVARLIRKPYFVPESKRIDSLMREMKRRRVHIAVAVDEYGGVSGIVCFEDILEEIVGDIQDEFDNEREDILEIGDGTYLCDARINLEELNERINAGIPEEEFDTLGGFVFDLFGKIPVRYEKVSYEHIDFVIQEMDGHKIKTVKIVLSAPESEGET
jgi:CBS domain containing-hemolysin-like protein